MKKIIVGLLSILVIFLVTAGVSAKCVDTDATDANPDGFNVWIKGTASHYDLNIPNETQVDACIVKGEGGLYNNAPNACSEAGKCVYERLCARNYETNNNYMLAEPKYYICPNGCVDGACVNATSPRVSCSDSDGGANIYIKGTTTGLEWSTSSGATGRIISVTDSCISSTRVSESACIRTSVPSTDNIYVTTGYMDCPSGTTCSDGICVNNTLPVCNVDNDCSPKTNSYFCNSDGQACSNIMNFACYQGKCVNSSTACSPCQTGTSCSGGKCVNNTQSNSCVDTDGGINLYQKGTSTRILNGQTTIKNDYCKTDIDSTHGTHGLVEYSCPAANSNTVFVEGIYFCPSGDCQNGACVNTVYSPIIEQDIDDAKYIKTFPDTKIYIADYQNDNSANLNNIQVWAATKSQQDWCNAIGKKLDNIPEEYRSDVRKINFKGNIILKDMKSGNSAVLWTTDDGIICGLSVTNDENGNVIEAYLNKYPSDIESDNIIDPNNVDKPIEVPSGTDAVCQGCLKDEKCYPFGYRKAGQYCLDNGNFQSQLNDNAACENNFECESNVCLSSKCVSEGLIRKILNWFKRLFGKE